VPWATLVSLPSIAVSRACAWISRNKPKLWLALRMTVASALALVVALGLALPQGYWTVLTAVIVTQTSVGGSVKAALDRLGASLCGAIYGAGVTFLIPHQDPLSMGAALVMAVAPLAVLAAFNASFRLAPITAIIVLLSTTSTELGPLRYAADRVLEVALGCAIGVAVSTVLAPARAYIMVLEAATQVTALLADELDAFAVAVSGPPPQLGELPEKIRKALNRLETLTEEAARERSSRLSDDPDPEPLYRTLRRLRHDIVALGRVLAEPLPEAVHAHLADAWSCIAHGTAEYLRELSKALGSRQMPPNNGSVAECIIGYKTAIDGMRERGLTRALSADVAARVFGILFILDQLRSNLDDLASRAAESARQEE
jgi:uncharacterized membrane protein YccC